MRARKPIGDLMFEGMLGAFAGFAVFECMPSPWNFVAAALMLSAWTLVMVAVER